MNKIFLKYAKKAGFIFWKKNESPHHQEDDIDWASDYTKELEKFAVVLIKQTLKEVEKNLEKEDNKEMVIKKVKKHFNIK